MYKIDFKGKVKDVTGNEFNVALTLALALQHATAGDAIKFNAWATKLVMDGELIMDKSDSKTLQNYIEETSNIINLLKANILERIENKMEVKNG